MELRQFEYFVAVAEEASFTRAAARVNISQSGVSAQVRQLERELGHPLLERSPRRVRLTAAGLAFLPHARAALRAATSARQAVDELAGLVRGKVSVGMVNGCSLPVLAELLAQFHRRYPGVAVALHEGPSDQLVRSLRQGSLDLALIGAAGGSVPGVDGLVLLDDTLVAVVDETSALARRTSLTVASLHGEPIVCLPKGTGVRAAFDGACGAAGFTPQVVFEASALSIVAHLACLGLGIGIVPSSAARAHAASSRVLRIAQPEIRSRLELVWAKETTTHPAARVLVEYAHQFVDQLGGDGT